MIENELDMRTSTHIIVSKTAYLIGVSKDYFFDANEDNRLLELEVFEEMDKKKEARIVRNLTILRNTILQKWKTLNDKIRTDNTAFPYLTDEFIPTKSIQELGNYGINLSYNKKLLAESLIEINNFIKDRINNCKKLIPDWINWEYYRDIFIMPNGSTQDGCRVSSEVYYYNKNSYPFQCYINWTNWSSNTVILHSDYLFLKLLYEQNHEEFVDGARVSIITDNTREKFYKFLEESKNVDIVVDCENANPFHLYAVLYDLEDRLLENVKKIILYNDVNTTVAWEFIGEQLSIPVESILTERVLDRKSLVDIALSVGTCREHFKNEIDSFILVSSDSDYWALISAMTEANFLVLMERSRCSTQMRGILADEDIFYCFMEDFPLEISDELREKTVYKELRKVIDEKFDVNLYDLLDDVIKKTRADFPGDSEKNLRARIERNIRLEIEDDGRMNILFNDK